MIEWEEESPSELLHPQSAIHLFERALIVEGVPQDDDVLADMFAWIQEQTIQLGFDFHKQFRKRAANLGLYWEDR